MAEETKKARRQSARIIAKRARAASEEKGNDDEKEAKERNGVKPPRQKATKRAKPPAAGFVAEMEEENRIAQSREAVRQQAVPVPRVDERGAKEVQMEKLRELKMQFPRPPPIKPLPVHKSLPGRIASGVSATEPAQHKSDGESTSSSDDDDEEGWEEVEGLIAAPSTAQHHVQPDVVEVEIQPAANGGAQNGAEKWEKYVKLAIARKEREFADACHKAHLLCFIAHLQFHAKVAITAGKMMRELLEKLPAPELQIDKCAPITSSFIERLVGVVRSKFLHTVAAPSQDGGGTLRHLARLKKLLLARHFQTDRDLAMMFFALCHGVLKLTTRLCLAFEPMPKVVDDDDTGGAGADCEPSTSARTTKKGKAGEKANAAATTKKKSSTTDQAHVRRKAESAESTRNREVASAPARNYWIEYYDEEEKRWICVDPLYKLVDAPAKIHEKARSPMLYVFAIDSQMGARDVTARYAGEQLLLPSLRKMRVEESWLEETLNLKCLKADDGRAQLEDDEMMKHLRSIPMPTRVGDFKNHPLYVLEKDLLKFEAIYPEDTKSLGKLRNYDIYPRENVYTLQSTLNWIKEARTVKEGEEPYKTVKARPKLHVPKEQRVPLMLDVYGIWQTEPYIPPEVEDGVIPRNEYGNLYVYQESMVPNGCEHLRLPGIYQIARRLDLDAVPAVVGWEFSGCNNHPLIEGCVVLQEDVETLRDAWEEATSKKEAAESKKISERAWKNWRRLIKGKRLLEQMRSRFTT